MFILEVLGLLLFVLLISLGYKKNNRNLMLLASICLIVSFGVPDFITGFSEGYANGSPTDY
ncbi:hypothetical protein [Colwellia sp. Bg11-12]|jgi:hypothetical protein|uniref:hypothetical protein n=1 Tax=Colwellia sp. Bg11-12 TaxID=2759817 RepID=UPI0015F74E95|nr:hypothetical protein [Colwellia sp. Bg11-12]MBA6262131.1 hypothetical protein [Colwellia sp. Bg11-12]